VEKISKWTAIHDNKDCQSYIDDKWGSNLLVRRDESKNLGKMSHQHENPPMGTHFAAYQRQVVTVKFPITGLGSSSRNPYGRIVGVHLNDFET
jgi:hypothetical protein